MRITVDIADNLAASATDRYGSVEEFFRAQIDALARDVRADHVAAITREENEKAAQKVAERVAAEVDVIAVGVGEGQ